MSSAVLENIVRNHSALAGSIGKLEKYLARQRVGRALRLDSVADFVGVDPAVLRPVLDALVAAAVLERNECLICPDCEVPLEGDVARDRRVECDLCSKLYGKTDTETEECYSLVAPVVARGPSKSTSGGTPRTNPLRDVATLQRVQMKPWQMLAEEDYTISVTTLDDGRRKEALKLLQMYGIARLRWQGDPPSSERLGSFEMWVGPARSEQNDFAGKVKALRPNYEVEANTGDSAKALPFHVDGTQDERPPAILAFQYDLSPTWGGESTFVDMAAVLSELPYDELERVLVALAQRGCGTCTKTKGEWTKTFTGPLVRAESGGSCASLRYRPDSVLQVVEQCRPAFDELSERIAAWEKQGHVLTYTPHEGDIVLFDNWRVLHGRARIGGRHQRIHDRMWIDSLLPKHAGQFSVGIRGLGNELMHAIERANQG